MCSIKFNKTAHNIDFGFLYHCELRKRHKISSTQSLNSISLVKFARAGEEREFYDTNLVLFLNIFVCFAMKFSSANWISTNERK